MRRCSLVIILVLFPLALGISEGSPDRVWSSGHRSYFYVATSENSNAKLIVFNARLGKEVVLQDGYLRYPVEFARWYDDNLFEVHVATGSPTFYAIFYSVDRDETSDIVYYPIAVDAKRELVAAAQDRVFISAIFTPSRRYYLDRPFKATAILWLVVDSKRTFFDDSGNLHIRYQSTDDSWREESLQIDTSMLSAAQR